MKTKPGAASKRSRRPTPIAVWQAWSNSPRGLAWTLLSKMALKIAVAATLADVVAEALHWSYPFYAVIAAVIVLGSTAGNTLTLSVQRLIGTAIGAIGGALVAVLLGHSPWSLAISVFLTILLASAWKFNEAAKLAGYVSAIVILNYHHSPWLYAWGRSLETLLGIGSAVLVSHLLFPARAGDELRRCLSDTLLSLEQFYGLVMQGALTGAYDRTTVDALKLRIIALLNKGRDLWQEVRQGQAGESPETRVHPSWEFLVRRIWEHILTLEHTILARQQQTFWQMLTPYLATLQQETATTMSELAAAVKAREPDIPLGTLDNILSQATEQINTIQRLEQTDYPMDELLRFFTFFYTVEEIGRKLQRLDANL